MHAKSEPFHSFSIMAKCSGCIDENIRKEVLGVLNQERFGSLSLLSDERDVLTFQARLYGS